VLATPPTGAVLRWGRRHRQQHARQRQPQQQDFANRSAARRTTPFTRRQAPGMPLPPRWRVTSRMTAVRGMPMMYTVHATAARDTMASYVSVYACRTHPCHRQGLLRRHTATHTHTCTEKSAKR